MEWDLEFMLLPSYNIDYMSLILEVISGHQKRHAMINFKQNGVRLVYYVGMIMTLMASTCYIDYVWLTFKTILSCQRSSKSTTCHFLPNEAISCKIEWDIVNISMPFLLNWIIIHSLSLFQNLFCFILLLLKKRM